MNKTYYVVLVALVCLIVIAFIAVDESEASPAPGRRKSKSKSGSSWFGSSQKKQGKEEDHLDMEKTNSARNKIGRIEIYFVMFC